MSSLSHTLMQYQFFPHLTESYVMPKYVDKDEVEAEAMNVDEYEVEAKGQDDQGLISLGDIECKSFYPYHTAPTPDEVTLIRLRILKLFEDMIYITVGSIAGCYRRKYGVPLNKAGNSEQYIRAILPLHLTHQKRTDIPRNRKLISLTDRPPLPTGLADVPFTLATLRMRILRLCPTVCSAVAVVPLYEEIYGPLQSAQPEPTDTPPSNGGLVSFETWVEIIRWARTNPPKKCPALYAEVGDEREINLINYVGPSTSDGWTKFVGTDGTVCVHNILFSSEPFNTNLGTEHVAESHDVKMGTEHVAESHDVKMGTEQQVKSEHYDANIDTTITPVLVTQPIASHLQNAPTRKRYRTNDPSVPVSVPVTQPTASNLQDVPILTKKHTHEIKHHRTSKLGKRSVLDGMGKKSKWESVEGRDERVCYNLS
ncbi:hypothetical protein BC938DRAFT_475210 [Jimgerdemannia flammicorona]|uniref:Uncharacterized protein n=1 Tax=Jimgerdemannia flammicorona TaxID=994334 RepID=A0A433QRY1_9FUNG|nr:hypothetical protein BC938DRAFT_475210 [Jimgerdemannia flammicorona]